MQMRIVYRDVFIFGPLLAKASAHSPHAPSECRKMPGSQWPRSHALTTKKPHETRPCPSSKIRFGGMAHADCWPLWRDGEFINHQMNPGSFADASCYGSSRRDTNSPATYVSFLKYFCSMHFGVQWSWPICWKYTKPWSCVVRGLDLYPIEFGCARPRWDWTSSFDAKVMNPLWFLRPPPPLRIDPCRWTSWHAPGRFPAISRIPAWVMSGYIGYWSQQTCEWIAKTTKLVSFI